MSRRRRRLLVALLVAMTLAGVFSYLVGFVGGSSRDPVRLLVTRPALPAYWIDASDGDARTPIFWRQRQGGSTTDVSGCDLGRGAVRGWSHGGDSLANPDAFEKVCVYRSRFVAWAANEWQSLNRVGGEDWPNFEPDADARTVPRHVASLEGLRADQWRSAAGSVIPTRSAGSGRSALDTTRYSSSWSYARSLLD
jgi:hypothetical protein